MARPQVLTSLPSHYVSMLEVIQLVSQAISQSRINDLVSCQWVSQLLTLVKVSYIVTISVSYFVIN
jgi:hypothetical protein